MPDSIDLHRWQDHLEQIAKARKVQDYHGAKLTQWFLVIATVFVAIWIFAGINIAMVALIGIMFLLVNFGFKKGPLASLLKQKNHSEARSSVLENKLFQSIAKKAAPWLNVHFTAPSVGKELKSSSLIRGRLDYINSSRCLSGCYLDSIPFCAVQTEAGRIEKYLDSNKRVQTVQKTVFQGVFVLFDFPSMAKGWVSLESDYLEKAGWLANEWRNAGDESYVLMENPEFERHFHVRASDREDAFRILTPSLMVNLVNFANQCPSLPYSITMREGVLMALIPMKDSPFALRVNQDVWSDDLQRFSSLVETLIALVENLNGRSTRQQEFSA